MSPQPSSSRPDQQAEDAQHYRHLLHDMMDMGSSLARAVHDRALGQAEPPTPAHAQTFDCLARAVRRTILLARHVAQPLPARASEPCVQHRVAVRKRILRGVEDSIAHNAGKADGEALHAEFLERLDAPDLDEEIDGRPVKDIVADICRDLGLVNQPGFTPYKRRTPADIERLCARAATPPAAKPRAEPPPIRPPGIAPPRAAPIGRMELAIPGRGG